jgi:hypothetical protein
VKIVLINGLAFATKKAAEEHFRQILYRWPAGFPIDGPDFDDLCALIANHPEAEQKIGCGIARIDVRLNPFGTLGFWLRRVDDTETDWSFLTAVSGKPKSLAARWRSAARNAVRPSIEAFKDRADWVCALTARPLQKGDEHVDHAPPHTFEDIVVAFCETYPDAYADHHLEPPADQQFTTNFISPALAQTFRLFHDRMALLRMVHRTDHLRLSRKARA